MKSFLIFVSALICIGFVASREYTFFNDYAYSEEAREKTKKSLRKAILKAKLREKLKKSLIGSC